MTACLPTLTTLSTEATTEILPIADTAATSDPIEVTDKTLFCLKGTDDVIPRMAIVEVLMIGDGSHLVPVAKMTKRDPALLLFGPGTYRFRRSEGEVGLFSA